MKMDDEMWRLRFFHDWSREKYEKPEIFQENMWKFMLSFRNSTQFDDLTSKQVFQIFYNRIKKRFKRSEGTPSSSLATYQQQNNNEENKKTNTDV